MFMSTTTSPSDKSTPLKAKHDDDANSTKDESPPSASDSPPAPTAMVGGLDDIMEEHLNEQQKKSYRDRYGEHYTNFRENPGASARKGAESMGEMFRMYGPVFVGTYLSVYVSTLGALYAGVQSGALDPVALFGWLGQDTGECHNTVDLVVEWMQKYSFTEAYAPSVEKHPYLANLGVAWIATKFTEPIRLAVALPLTPQIAKYFGYGPKEPIEPETDITATATEAASTPDQAEADTSSSKIPPTK
jgi:hypothetical protein